MSTLINVGFGEVVGREFSYGNVYEEHRHHHEREKNNATTSNTEDKQHTLSAKVELEMKGRLIDGISLTTIGLFLLLIHLFSRRWIETESERLDSLRKLYLIAGLVFFSIVTFGSLATGIPETLRYALFRCRARRRDSRRAPIYRYHRIARVDFLPRCHLEKCAPLVSKIQSLT